MVDELNFDPNSMKMAAAKGGGILLKIQGEIESLEKYENPSTGSYAPIKRLEELKEICSGYEKLLLYMNAAANVYGRAEISLTEMMDF